MKTNAAGIKLIKGFEQCRLEAYQDVRGVWTIGWGHTAGVHEGDRITQAEADEIFEKELPDYEAPVMHLYKYPLNENEFSALVSFCYNEGPGNLKMLLHGRNNKQIAAALLLYNKVRKTDENGNTKLVYCAGLARRREAEQKLFLTPVNS